MSLFPLIFWAVLIIVLAPAATLVHEIGHAFASLSLTRLPVSVQLGSKPSRSLVIGRLSLQLRPLTGLVGFCKTQNMSTVSPARQAAVLLAGPLISIASFFGLGFVLAYTTLNPWLQFLVLRPLRWMFLIQGVITILPIKYPGWFPGYANRPSDALQAIRLWSSRSSHDAAV